MTIETHNVLIESILEKWKARIGVDFPGYRGHVYRVFNFCLALHECTSEDREKLAIAVCFHDIGLWSAQTVDYIPPSLSELKQYLIENGKDEWIEEVSLMVELHHKVTKSNYPQYPLVELFRKGDLVDFSKGILRSGLPRKYIKEVKLKIPNNGFHRFLLNGAKQWFLEHPLRPPPFMKW